METVGHTALRGCVLLFTCLRDVNATRIDFIRMRITLLLHHKSEPIGGRAPGLRNENAGSRKCRLDSE